VTTRRRVAPISRLKTTLRAHYRKKRRFYGLDRPRVYDEDLLRVFTDAKGRHESAARFLGREGPDLRRRIARATGSYQYTIGRVLRDITARARELRLRLRAGEAETRLELAVVLTAQVMEHMAHGRHRVVL